MPLRVQMTDNDPITLAEAAAHFRLTKGVLKAEGLRGNLTMFRLGKTYYTTATAIREWIGKCRVEPKARGFISINGAANGLSETARNLCEQAALSQSLSALRSS